MLEFLLEESVVIVVVGSAVVMKEVVVGLSVVVVVVVVGPTVVVILVVVCPTVVVVEVVFGFVVVVVTFVGQVVGSSVERSASFLVFLGRSQAKVLLLKLKLGGHSIILGAPVSQA